MDNFTVNLYSGLGLTALVNENYLIYNTFNNGEYEFKLIDRKEGGEAVRIGLYALQEKCTFSVSNQLLLLCQRFIYQSR